MIKKKFDVFDPKIHLSEKIIKFPRRTIWVGDCIALVKEDGWGNTENKSNSPDDYLRIKVKGKRWGVHRLSYHLNNGKISCRPKRTNDLVLHRCDNKWCVNPKHLYLGSYSDNAKDNVARNEEWHKNRSIAQKKIGFPPASPEARKRIGRINSIKMKIWAKNHPEETKKKMDHMREVRLKQIAERKAKENESRIAN